jgi:predicted phosphoribosyltransferase
LRNQKALYEKYKGLTDEEIDTLLAAAIQKKKNEEEE